MTATNKNNIVIIGGGTAAMKIAATLSQEGMRVTVIEAGNKPYPFIYTPPLMVGTLFNTDKYLYRDITIPQASLNNREIPFFRGKILGGSSEMNGCVHAFGCDNRYNEVFEGLIEHPSEIFRSYMLKNIRQNKNDTGLYIEKLKGDELTDVYLDTCKNMGYEYTDDYNDVFNGVSRLQLNTRRGRRFSSRKAYLNKRNSKNIKFINNAVVERLIIQNNVVKGVVLSGSRGEEIYANKCILAAGTVGTPAVLERSGIGCDSVLSLNDIKIQKENKNVGENLTDHPNFRVNVRAKNISTLNDKLADLSGRIFEAGKYLISRTNLIATPGATSHLLISLENKNYPDIKIQLIHFTEGARLGEKNKKITMSSSPGFALGITLMWPKSTGSTHINCKNEKGIDINPRYLNDDRDIDLACKALKLVIKILQTKPLSNYVDEIEKLDEIINAPVEYLKNNTYSGYHPLGTCRMSTTKHNGVVDKQFGVYGIDNLYICDGSVLPTHVSSNCHFPIVLLAEHFIKTTMKQLIN